MSGRTRSGLLPPPRTGCVSSSGLRFSAWKYGMRAGGMFGRLPLSSSATWRICTRG